MGETYYIGVDVGTSSVRAGLVSRLGSVVKMHTIPITVSNPKPDFYEQDSEEIWTSVCEAVKFVTSEIADKSSIHGLGFDATCSLVVLDGSLKPVTVSPATGEDRFNIMMWMDHRAKEQADRINAGGHEVLKYVGGKVSLEMQTPKLLWLKTHLKETWRRASHFLDLPDFLTFRATGRLSRSLCSTVCKWTYKCDGISQEWDRGFFKDVGLEDLAEDGWRKIGQEVLPPGTDCGQLSAEAAAQLGLSESTHVATSLIDAHAGGLALVSAQAKAKEDLVGRLGLICGTSTCHMCVSEQPIFVPGVWGPYLSAMVPDCWLNEGGQSATGALVDHVIKSHPASAKCPQSDKYGWLEGILTVMAKEKGLAHVSLLTKDVHVYPDFHGNRSPLAEPSMMGMVCGLTLDVSERNLAVLYLATIQALAYGTRHIVEQLQASGHVITSVLMCGGLSNSPVFISTHADALGVPVLIPATKQSVLLGSAMLGAAASGDFPDLTSAAIAMGGAAQAFHPTKELKEYHDKKYGIFKRMQTEQLEYRRTMGSI
ncbi:putative FGGY carbohydrate kinase domain-containing protein-like [Penaeus vannamei]|uniref:FGGY carbohydrate kinase domain-containing protein n=1 Tax=Penaeus vannamei TaxID=6689 RepID=A0A3R7M094_PENVA|nr:FGGY carbohydrate kinase domain-containing protein-like [Penaeus vannamei]XP_027231252.1 FGGY carbohydrate kinase domain-containing protein-like [Penaeus vannamei]ROT63789.1 putative FGGY carbohydrate kinase domain-containing protein-like [Penaeus vannamei]